MRPHRLRVTAFGAFAGTETVTFDDLEGLFLLHGETGAGKTTLLDAIAFALYGRVPGERGQAKRLRSDHAAPGTSTEVELEATIGGRRLRITRRPEQERPKKSGTGTTREQASVRVDERTQTGTWDNKSARVAEADAEIAGLMGMSAEQFFQVVLLPQGQFAQFLRARAQDKETLLQKLFGTDRFRKVEDWLADRRRATEKEVQAASETVSRLVAQVAQAAGVPVPDAPPAPAQAAAASGAPGAWEATWAAALTEQAAAAADAAAARVQARKRDLDQALAAKAQAEQLADRQRRRRDAERRQREAEEAAPAIEQLRAEADAAARAAEVIAVLDAAARAATVADSARAAEATARDALRALPVPPAPAPTAPARPPHDASPADLREAAGQCRAHLGRLDALRAVARQASGEAETAAAARARAAALDQALTTAQDETRRRRAARPQAVQARDAASQATAALPAAQRRAEIARRVAADSAALARERANRDGRHESHLAARENAVALRAEALRIREARIDGMSAELAANLFDGHECPVCGSLDHPNPKEPTFDLVGREQEDAANAAADKATDDADLVGRELAAIDARLGELVQRLAESGFSRLLTAAPEPFSAATALRADPAALSAAARQAGADAKREEAIAAQLEAQAAASAELQRHLDDLEKSIANDEARLVQLAGQRDAALDEAAAADARAADRREELRAQLGDATDVDAAIAATSRHEEALTAAAAAADETSRTAAAARDAADRAVQAAAGAGFASTGSARAASRDPRWRRDAADRVKHHEAETEAVATLLAGADLIGVQLVPPAPVAEHTLAAETAQQAYDAVNQAHATARHTASQLASLQPRLATALADLQPLRDRADQIKHLADLAAGVGTANQYRMTLSSFVLAARLEEVAQAASERLLTMTAGRYSLVHSDARKGNAKAGLSLLACDAWTGIDRDTATLSGGETFLASLALALGLADVVTAESAGSPMEALFVDEGFGTLDEDTLDEVMTVLDTLRAGGRIVGIVSHVTELRQRIPAQVQVRKSRHGSHVEVIAG